MEPQPPIPDVAAIKAATEAVLRQPEFADARNEHWFEILIRTLKEWADAWGEWSLTHPVATWILIAFLILILIGLLTHIFYAAFSDMLPFGQAKSAGTRSVATTAILEGAADNWQAGLDKAIQALQNGNERLAVWIGHRVLLGLLDEAGSIRFARGKTNTDYLKECSSEHPWHDTFRHLTQTYDNVVYGHRIVDVSLLRSLLDQVRSFLPSQRHAS